MAYYKASSGGQTDVVSKDILKFWITCLNNLDARENKNDLRQLEIAIRDLVFTLEDALLEKFSHEVQSTRRRGTGDIIRKINMISRVKHASTFISNTITDRNIKLDSEAHTHYQREDNIVGMDDEFMSLGDIMFGKDRSLRAICIYGKNGLGKTALARKLFTINRVRYHFDCCAWVVLGKNFTWKSVLKDMLEQLSQEKELSQGEDKIENSDLNSLRESLYKSLEGRRYLVVVDDMQSLEPWDFLHKLFPNDQNRSRLIVTTRVREVATLVAGDDQDGFICAKRNLNQIEASELFQEMTGNNVDPIMKQCGEDILKECRGSPSAIVAVGQLLAAKCTSDDWMLVLRNAKLLQSRGLQIDQIGFEQPISDSSFDNLPYHLKPCFLCLGLFPEGSPIPVEHLYLLWMAEGIISTDDCQYNEAMMDLAERYLGDLVQRKLVEVEQEESRSMRKYKSCTVHKDVKDLCFQKGKGYFFKALSFGQMTQTTADSSSQVDYPARRIALHLNEQDNTSVDHLKNELNKHIRSLLLFNLLDLQTKWKFPRRLSDMKKFRTLRVLTFDSIDFKKTSLPKGLAKLVYLKYLSFKGCVLLSLPSSIGNLPFLEILDLRVSHEITITIPNVLRKLEKLRYLYLPFEFSTPTNGKLDLGSLKELEVLENFDTRVCAVADLFEMMKLQYLSVTVLGITWDTKGTLWDLDQIVSRLDKTFIRASALRSFVKIENFDCYTEEIRSAFKKLLMCQALHAIHINGHIGKLPPKHEITSSLIEIVLRGSQLKEDPMVTLNEIRNLQVLELHENTYSGKEMKCESGFQQLKRLKLDSLSFLEKFSVNCTAMPKLSIITIRNCRNLKKTMIQRGFDGRFPPVTIDTDIS